MAPSFQGCKVYGKDPARLTTLLDGSQYIPPDPKFKTFLTFAEQKQRSVAKRLRVFPEFLSIRAVPVVI